MHSCEPRSQQAEAGGHGDPVIQQITTNFVESNIEAMSSPMPLPVLSLALAVPWWCLLPWELGSDLHLVSQH